MANRRTRVIRNVLLVAPLLMLACAETTRHRVLSFFFDGVPEPGAARSQGPAPGAGEGGAPAPGESAKPARPKRPIYAHPPYKQKRCRACHNPATMLLYKTPQEGLCQTCHPGVPGPRAYLHGPAAVNDCVACHDPHDSHYPKLLRSDPKEICFTCHQRGNLTTGAHHAEIDGQPCLECHDPHGGDNGFFLRRSER